MPLWPILPQHWHLSNISLGGCRFIGLVGKGWEVLFRCWNPRWLLKACIVGRIRWQPGSSCLPTWYYGQYLQIVLAILVRPISFGTMLPSVECLSCKRMWSKPLSNLYVGHFQCCLQCKLLLHTGCSCDCWFPNIPVLETCCTR